MNAEQKRAWLGVATTVACVVGYFALLPFLGPGRAIAVFALFGINGLAGMIGKKEKADERDAAIARKAAVFGFTVSYLVFVFGCMGTWAVVSGWQGEKQVAAEILPIITVLGGIVCYFTRSVAILILYGRPMEAEDA